MSSDGAARDATAPIAAAAASGGAGADDGNAGFVTRAAFAPAPGAADSAADAALNAVKREDTERSFVSQTARGVAALRALEATRAAGATKHSGGDPLVVDGLAAALAGEAGFLWPSTLSDARRDFMVDFLAVRTRAIDDEIQGFAAEGREVGGAADGGSVEAAGADGGGDEPQVRSQVVILGAGLDARAVRLPGIEDVTVFEVDFKELLEWKLGVFASEGAKPTCAKHVTVAADLSLPDWADNLRAAGFRGDVRTLWLLEGLTGYLTREENDRLFARMRAASTSADCRVLATWVGASREVFGAGAPKSAFHSCCTDDGPAIATAAGWAEARQEPIGAVARRLGRGNEELDAHNYWFMRAAAAAADDNKYVRHFRTAAAQSKLEDTYVHPEIVAQRAFILEHLELRAGQRVADIGCGPGFLLADMIPVVAGGESGGVVGVDVSADGLQRARVRCADAVKEATARCGAPESTLLSLMEGSATAIPLPDNSVDAIVCVQVLEYVRLSLPARFPARHLRRATTNAATFRRRRQVPQEDMPKALAEFKRVLRPGGRALCLDTDWTAKVYSATAARADRVLAASHAHFADSALPPKMPRLLRAAGLRLRRAAAYPLVCAGSYATDSWYDPAFVARSATRHGVPEEEARAWLEEMQQQSRDGEFYCAASRSIIVAEKPSDE